MTLAKRLVVIALALLAPALLAGCGGSSKQTIAPSGRLVPVPGSSAGKIVLSSVGAQRIGIQTARVSRVPAPPPPPAPPPKTKLVHTTRGVVKVTVPVPAPKPTPSRLNAVVPVAAVIYDPSGKTYVFTSPSTLQYTEVPVTVDHVSGDSAYLLRGPRPGSTVVTVGAEELFGVQTGVLAQT